MAVRWAIVESRGKPKPKMPLTSSTKETFVEFTRPMENIRVSKGWMRSYRPKAC